MSTTRLGVETKRSISAKITVPAFMFFGLIVSNVHIWMVSDQGLSKSVGEGGVERC